LAREEADRARPPWVRKVEDHDELRERGSRRMTRYSEAIEFVPHTRGRFLLRRSMPGLHSEAAQAARAGARAEPSTAKAR
jgi:hypothetical protein